MLGATRLPCPAAVHVSRGELLPLLLLLLLCRWTSAGAFYPFVRNHYTYDSRNHEPYRCD